MADAMSIAEPSEAEREMMNPTPLATGGKSRKERKKIPRYIEKFEAIQVPTKPGSVDNKAGNAGQAVALSTNYVNVTLRGLDVIKQFQVDILPIQTIRGKKFSAIREWSKVKDLPKHSYVYDGGSALYAGPDVAIPDESTESVDCEGAQVSVRVYKVSSLDMQHPQMMVLLNTQIMRYQENDMGLIRINECCFDPKQAKACIPERITIWPGCETAIGVYENKALLMSVDPRFRIIRLETAMEAIRSKFVQCTRQGMSIEEAQKKAGAEVKGSTVETAYNNKTYRIQAVDWEKNPAQTFSVKDRKSGEEKQVSFKDYFREHYNVNITDDKQPMLIAKPTNRESRRRGDEQIALVPELCRMTGYTDAMRANFQTMKAVAVHTKLAPTQRKAFAQGFIAKLTSNPKIMDQAHGWGVDYGTQMINLKGRNLGVQTLQQGNNSLQYQMHDTDWTKSMRGSRVEDPKNIERWVVLYVQNDENSTRQFVDHMKNVGGAMGINFGAPRVVKVVNDQPQSFVAACRANQVDKGCQLVFAVFPNPTKDRYDAFKQLLCCTVPCISQVVLSKTVNHKSAMSVATKVVQQINAKLAGQIWKCNLPFKVPTMVVGIDTHRDRTAKCTVVVATATVNQKYGNYASFSDTVEEDDDVFKMIAVLINKCMEAFKRRNKISPQKVIIYRDGVSDGQLKNMMATELPQVLEMLGAESTQEKILCTYVLVNKRESTRFFVEQGSTQANPLSGTVVDHTVTRPWRFDFYLVSQSVREGTVAPTYYNCVHDSNGLSPDLLQNMTYLLCHMYFNWPGTIRVPAPVQYAKKYAQLRALNLHEQTNDKLVDNLFYL